MIPGNPYSTRGLDAVISHDDIAQAILALAHEQHRTANAAERQAAALEYRVRLAAITAKHRGLTLPTDLEDLTQGKP